MTDPYPFGVSEFTTWPWSFERDVETYARLNVDTIELCEFKLEPTAAAAATALARIRDAGLTVSSVQSRLHSLFPDQPRPEPQASAERMKRLRESIVKFSPAGPETTFVSISGAAPQGNYRAAFDTAVREYSSIAAFAADHGARVAVEPLNPILMNADTFICSLSEGLRLVEAVNHPSFGIFVDVWHVFQDAAAPDLIRRCGPRIFGVHVNDWHAPRCFGDRATIGTGIIPLAPLLRAIRESGYRGAYTVEIFSDSALPDSLWNADLEQVIEANRAGLKRAWAASF